MGPSTAQCPPFSVQVKICVFFRLPGTGSSFIRRPKTQEMISESMFFIFHISAVFPGRKTVKPLIFRVFALLFNHLYKRRPPPEGRVSLRRRICPAHRGTDLKSKNLFLNITQFLKCSHIVVKCELVNAARAGIPSIRLQEEKRECFQEGRQKKERSFVPGRRTLREAESVSLQRTCVVFSGTHAALAPAAALRRSGNGPAAAAAGGVSAQVPSQPR